MNRVDFFGHIDSKEKAYAIGYIANKISVYQDKVIITDSLSNKHIMDLIISVTGGEMIVSKVLNKQSGIYPSVQIIITHKPTVKILTFYFHSELFEQPNIPRMTSSLTPYCILGLYHSTGNFRFGIRKDRGRIWGRMQFKASFSVLSSLQSLLLFRKISSALKPMVNSKSFLLEFNNHESIVNFYDILPKDMFNDMRSMNDLLEFKNMTKAIECPAS